jgi:hypothetical protein
MTIDYSTVRKRNEQAFREGERERREQIAVALEGLAGQIRDGGVSPLIVNQAASLVAIANGGRPPALDSRLRTR